MIYLLVLLCLSVSVSLSLHQCFAVHRGLCRDTSWNIFFLLFDSLTNHRSSNSKVVFVWMAVVIEVPRISWLLLMLLRVDSNRCVSFVNELLCCSESHTGQSKASLPTESSQADSSLLEERLFLWLCSHSPLCKVIFKCKAQLSGPLVPSIVKKERWHVFSLHVSTVVHCCSPLYMRPAKSERMSSACKKAEVFLACVRSNSTLCQLCAFEYRRACVCKQRAIHSANSSV